jgi:NAD(P)-dependent dehydrogenase (short-subunit alcohol dehydrogenase family)
MAEFTGQVALITGAAAGIGRATALAFAAAGAALVLADTSDAAAALAAEITAGGGDALFVRTDVSDASQAEALMRAALARHRRIHVAFNNAGITSYIDTWDEAAMLRVIAVNLHGVMFAMKHQVAHMLEHGGGAIVNTASIAGLSAAGTVEYCASKHGVVGVTRAAAVRYAPGGLRINAVCPGVIETDMTRPLLADAAIRDRLHAMVPMGRLGRAEEIADVVLFLASSRASFITGQAIVVDGGSMAK